MSVVMSWMGGTRCACPRKMSGGVAARSPRQSAAIGSHGRARWRGWAMKSTRISATAADASPTQATVRYMIRPTRQSHQPCFVPGPDTQSMSNANTAAASTKKRTLRMESLRGNSRVMEQTCKRIEIGGLGEMVVETRVDRTATVVRLAPPRERHQQDIRRPRPRANGPRRVVAVHARHADVHERHLG